jgi:ACT domain-containing protein
MAKARKIESEKNEMPVITVIGQDTKGIVAQVSTLLWKQGVNIEEIKQGVVRENFFMIMAVDLEGSGTTFHQLSSDLKKLGSKLDLDINIYNKEIFTAINKI